MCGLVGIAGDCSTLWRDVFHELLLVDSVRGVHSTGAGAVDRFQDKFRLAKRPGNPFDLFNTKDWDDLSDVKVPVKVLLGHNRYATVGDHTIENAHPFAFDKVIGMHNGTLDKDSRAALLDNARFGTDSEAIMYSINELGIDGALKNMSGAWALVWFDKTDNTINMLRNDRRPLHYAYSEDRCTLVWASELPMIKYVMERKGKKILDDKIYMTLKDTHFSWKVPDSIHTKFDHPTQEKREGHKFVWKGNGPFVGLATNFNGMMNGGYGRKKESDPTPFDKRRPSDSFRPPYKDLVGRHIKKKQLEPMLQEGCAMCNSNDQKWGDFVHILGNYSGYHTPYLCKSCYDDEDLYNIGKYAV